MLFRVILNREPVPIKHVIKFNEFAIFYPRTERKNKRKKGTKQLSDHGNFTTIFLSIDFSLFNFSSRLLRHFEV